MSDKIWFDPTSDKWVLSDGEHYLEVPHWAREIIADEFERETRQLKDENASLKNEVELLKAIWTQVRLEGHNFKTEIAKLREDLEFERSENGWAREFLNRMGQKCGTKDCPSLVAYVTKLEAENAKLRALCRDMYLVVELLDMDGARLQAHGRDADWRTLKERYDELEVDE